MTGIRTYTVQKKGCAERIAPIGTLSQNGYGERQRVYNGSYLTTNTSARTVSVSSQFLPSNRTETNAFVKRGLIGFGVRALMFPFCATRKKPTAPEGFPARSPTTVLAGPSQA